MNRTAFLDGGGQAADLIRARDWSSHPLGEPEGWADSLCSALSLILNSPESMILCWGEDLFFFFNEAYFPLLGPRLDWAMGERFDRVWADGLDQAQPIIDAALAGDSRHYDDLPWKLATDRGAADTWWSFSYSRVLDRHGQVAGLFIFTNETTQRVLSDAALARSQRHLSDALEELRRVNASLETRVVERTAERNLLATIVETTDSMVNVLDLDFRWLAINRAAVTAFERAFDVVPQVGDDMRALLTDHPADRADVERLWSRALAGEEYQVVAELGDARLGRRRSYDIKFNTMRDATGARIGAFQIVSDITDRLAAEAALAQAHDALRQSQKMEAMGQLTGGVAHDFNNLLTPIIGSLDLIQRRNGLSEREARLIDGALQSAERARMLVHRLLAFARRQPLQPGPVDLATLIDGMADLVASTTGPDIRVRTHLPPALPPALADANQLEMAILNLCVNARDAMPDGGTITVSADTGDDAEGYVRLSVTDTGVGMDEETARRAIEPFYSTKGIGKGTGLGLSMVHGLVAQLGGEMTIASRVGLGTRIDLRLPVSGDAAMTAKSVAVVAAPSLRGHVLVVDDEDLVRMATAAMLENLGYRIDEAGSVAEALAKLNGDDPYDLVVTDYLMPGGTGVELATLVKKRWPGLRTLIVSGYADVDAIAPDLPRLSKPFREAELAQTIAALG